MTRENTLRNGENAALNLWKQQLADLHDSCVVPMTVVDGNQAVQ